MPTAATRRREATLPIIATANAKGAPDQGVGHGNTFRHITFDPAASNTATITFAATAQRFLRLNITANTGWPAGQVSEFEVYGP